MNHDKTLDASRTRLLVSVRNADEAAIALEGGADIIDIKEPTRGPLGRADQREIEKILAVIDGKRPVSVALGELSQLDEWSADFRLPEGVAYVKLGLADQMRQPWSKALTAAYERFAPARPVAVAYWDASRVHAPFPLDVLQWGVGHPAAALLIDTADKSAPGMLSDVNDLPALKAILAAAREHAMPVALAGKLNATTFDAAIALSPAIVGVRSAVCPRAQRTGVIELERVQALAQKTAALDVPAHS